MKVVLLLTLIFSSCSLNISRDIASSVDCASAFKRLSQALSERELSELTYFVMPRIQGNGSLDDITAQLDDYKKMGVDQIWVGPVHTQAKADPIHGFNDHGYWTLDHGSIDPALGGEKAFKRLLQKANDLNIDIMLDTPINHFGYGESFIINGKKVFAGDENYFRMIHDQSEEEIWKLYGLIDNSNNASEVIRAQKELSQLPLSGLPSLNHQNPEVVRYLINSYKGFIDRGIRKFRVDAVKHVSFDFLAHFMNELSAYGASKGQEIEFLLELLVHAAQKIDILGEQILRRTHPNVKVQFIDFAHAANLRGIAYPGYDFSQLRWFIDYRNNSSIHKSKFIPFLENHDLEKPLPNAYTRRMAYGISEFISDNRTILYHGHEGASAGEEFSRQVIKGVDPDGEIAKIVTRVGNNSKGHTLAIEQAEGDFLVMSRVENGHKVFFAANKTGETRLAFKGEPDVDYRITFQDGSSSIHDDEIWIEAQSFAIIAPK